MKNFKIGTFVFILFSMLVLSNLPVVGQTKKAPDSKQKMGKKCNIPDLTEEQQKKIEELRVVFLKKTKKNKNLLAEKNVRLNTLRTADNVNMNEINKTIDEIGALQTQIHKDKEAHHQDIRKLLSDKQKVYFDSKKHGNKANHHKNGHHRGYKNGHNKNKANNCKRKNKKQ